MSHMSHAWKTQADILPCGAAAVKSKEQAAKDKMLFAAVAQTRPAGAPEIKLIRCSGAAVPAAKPVVQSTRLGHSPYRKWVCTVIL